MLCAVVEVLDRHEKVVFGAIYLAGFVLVFVAATRTATATLRSGEGRA